MPDLIMIAAEEKLLELELDENPVESFPCMPCLAIHKQARTQLYAYLTGQFFDDAQAMEVLIKELDAYGPFIYQLDDDLVTRIAETEEDDVPDIVEWWAGAAEMDTLGIYDEDLVELLSTFLYNLIHFCLSVRLEPELGFFVYADG